MKEAELWDAYDESFNRLEGVSLRRGESIPAGIYHLVCDVIVRHADGSFLLMKRHPDKPRGGIWEASAGGSALLGESPDACARRELLEETGILPHTMSEIGRSKCENRLYVEFLAEYDKDKDRIVLQEGETVDFRWVDAEELLAYRRRGLLATARILQFIPALCKD